MNWERTWVIVMTILLWRLTEYYFFMGSTQSLIGKFWHFFLLSERLQFLCERLLQNKVIYNKKDTDFRVFWQNDISKKGFHYSKSRVFLCTMNRSFLKTKKDGTFWKTVWLFERLLLFLRKLFCYDLLKFFAFFLCFF